MTFYIIYIKHPTHTQYIHFNKKSIEQVINIIPLITKKMPSEKILLEKAERRIQAWKEANDVGKFLDLSRLLSDSLLERVLESVLKLDNLQKLNLSNNRLTTLPDSIRNLVNLQVLDLTHNQLTTLPTSLFELKSLCRLDVSCNKLTHLPDSIGNLVNLQVLLLFCNQLTTLPTSLFELKSLCRLNLSYNKLTHLPDGFIESKFYNELNCYNYNTRLTYLPDNWGEITSNKSCVIS